MKRERQVANLVQEKRPPLGKLEKTGLSACARAGKRPFFIPEKLCLQKTLRQGGAIYLDEGFRASPAVSMDEFCHEPLARSGFSQDKDV